MSKQPAHTHITEIFHDVKPTKLRKGDSVPIGQRTYRVKSKPTKLEDGTVGITLRWGTKRKRDEVYLIVPKNLPFTARRFTRINHQR